MRVCRGVRGMVASLAVLAMVGSGSADVMFGLFGGSSWPIDKAADSFEPGWLAGVQGFLVTTPNLLLGGRIAYNRWPLDKAEIIAQNQQVLSQILGADIDGSTNIVELMPTARLRSYMEDWIVNFFAQAGVGVFIRATNASVEGVLADGTRVDQDIFDTNIGRVGLQAGGGVTLGAIDRFGIEIYPLYNWLFSSEELSQYISINLGVSVQLR